MKISHLSQQHVTQLALCEKKFVTFSLDDLVAEWTETQVIESFYPCQRGEGVIQRSQRVPSEQSMLLTIHVLGITIVTSKTGFFDLGNSIGVSTSTASCTKQASFQLLLFSRHAVAIARHYVIFWQIACMNSPHNSKG